MSDEKRGRDFITYFNSLNTREGEGLFRYAEVKQLQDAYDRLQAELAAAREECDGKGRVLISAKERMDQLRSQLATAVRALEWYASIENIMYGAHGYFLDQKGVGDWLPDNGERAQKALKAIAGEGEK